MRTRYFFCCVCRNYRNKETHLNYLGYKGGWLSCCKICMDKLVQDKYVDDNMRLIEYVPLYRIDQINEIKSDTSDDDDGEHYGNWHTNDGCESCGYEHSDGSESSDATTE